ncbi:hypothetical protein [Streptomyces lavendofoliae]|uniref:hypothetical protein n=1 Tax=Streptomyces lavendofoliae TaxID=67314 RepID=UPI003D939ADC
MPNDQTPPPPYAELRVGDLHLTLRRRPVRLLAGLAVLVCGGTGWLLGSEGTMPWP